MKVNFSTQNLAVSNSGKLHNFTANSCAANPLNKTELDIFTKSPVAQINDKNNVSFGAILPPDARMPIFQSGCENIYDQIETYADIFAKLDKRSFPDQKDMDMTMELFFEPSFLNPSCYPKIEPKFCYDDVNANYYPTKGEFQGILAHMFADSSLYTEGGYMHEYKPEDMSKIKDPKLRKEKIKSFVRDDMGRSLQKFGKDKYQMKIKNAEDVKVLAGKLYDDNMTLSKNGNDLHVPYDVKTSQDLYDYYKQMKIKTLKGVSQKKENTNADFFVKTSMHKAYETNQKIINSTKHHPLRKHAVVYASPELKELYAYAEPQISDEESKMWFSLGLGG